VKKPAKTVVRGWATIRIPPQPGNAPGRGKAAHARKPAARKPPPKGGPPKIMPGWFHPAVQAAQKKKAVAKKAKKHPKRQLALGEGVACCAAEALAASLRLAGVPVSDDDVLDLYWRTAPDADAGASILATLEAGADFGIGSIQPGRLDYRPLTAQECWRSLGRRPGTEVLQPLAEVVADGVEFFGREEVHALILGVDLPGPHAVLATPDGWHSWGELYDPWTGDIDEAWEVTWPAIR